MYPVIANETKDIRHNYSKMQISKMNTERMHKLFEKVTGRNFFNPYEERQTMILILNSYGPEQEVTTQVDIEEQANRYKTNTQNLVAAQIAEQYATVPGWKRDWIRRLRNNDKGASWSTIVELTGVYENLAYGIAKGQIYRWDFDETARIVATQSKPKITREFLGLSEHTPNDLDKFFFTPWKVMSLIVKFIQSI